MLKFAAGIIVGALSLVIVFHVLNAENEKLKIENDQFKAQQNSYNQQLIDNQTQKQFEDLLNQ